MVRFYQKKTNKTIAAWAMYDWGNSAYATAVMAGFFPIFFKEYFSVGLSVSESTGWLGVTNSLASLVIFVIAPFLGSYSDIKNSKKRLLSIFAFIGIFATLTLSFIGQGEHELASFFYFISLVGFMGANLFYDSLLNKIVDEKDMDYASSLGYSLGYLGGGLLFLSAVLLVQFHGYFGIESKADAVKLSFALTALWWLVFTLPLMLYVEEKKEFVSQRNVLEDLRKTLKEISRYKNLALFLVAYWFYIDGVDTVIKMAVDFGLSIGLESSDLITALLLIQFVGFPATLVMGKLSYKTGVKNLLLSFIGVYLAIVVWAYFMTTKTEFFAIAILVALVQGGVQALSRSFYGKMIPKGKSGEFFGFYNMMGKFASVFGPLLVGLTAFVTGDNRLSILSISVLFIAGGYLLFKVEDRGALKVFRLC